MGEMQNRLTTLDWENQLLRRIIDSGVSWPLVEETIAEEESAAGDSAALSTCDLARVHESVVGFLQLLKLSCRDPQWLLSFCSRRI